MSAFVCRCAVRGSTEHETEQSYTKHFACVLSNMVGIRSLDVVDENVPKFSDEL